MLKEAQAIHACPKGCMIYFGDRGDLQECPTCRERRFDRATGRPRSVFYYFPVRDRIKALFASKVDAELIRARLKRPAGRQPGQIDEAWDGRMWLDVFEALLGANPRNLALQAFLDGVRTGKKASSLEVRPLARPGFSHIECRQVWVLSLAVLNLPQWLRSKLSALWLTLLVPDTAISDAKGPGFHVFLGQCLRSLVVACSVAAGDSREWFSVMGTLLPSQIALLPCCCPEPLIVELVELITRGVYVDDASTGTNNHQVQALLLCETGDLRGIPCFTEVPRMATPGLCLTGGICTATTSPWQAAAVQHMYPTGQELHGHPRHGHHALLWCVSATARRTRCSRGLAAGTPGAEGAVQRVSGPGRAVAPGCAQRRCRCRPGGQTPAGSSPHPSAGLRALVQGCIAIRLPRQHAQPGRFRYVDCERLCILIRAHFTCSVRDLFMVVRNRRPARGGAGKYFSEARLTFEHKTLKRLPQLKT